MVDCLDRHPLFRRIENEKLEKSGDICYKEIFNATEEGKKVERNKGEKWPAVYERLPNP